MSSELIRLEPNCFRSTIHLTLELFIFSSKPCSQKCTTKNEQDFDGKSRKKEQGHQNISDSIRIHQNPSEPTRTHKKSPVPMSTHPVSSKLIRLEPNSFRSTIYPTIKSFNFWSRPRNQKYNKKQNEQDFDGKSRNKEEGHGICGSNTSPSTSVLDKVSSWASRMVVV